MNTYPDAQNPITMNTPTSYSLTVDPLSSLDLPFKKTVGSKLDSLYEITYLSDEDKGFCY